MSELLQFIIVVAFGAFCFGCGVLTAFIVTRNKRTDDTSSVGVGIGSPGIASSPLDVCNAAHHKRSKPSKPNLAHGWLTSGIATRDTRPTGISIA